MSRREIIVVVAIVNIALLAILFITAERLEDIPPSSVTVAIASPAADELPAATPTISQSRISTISEIPVDEVDTVLRDFAVTVAASHKGPYPDAPLTTGEVPVDMTSPGSVYTDIVVKKGDFLEKIARQHNTTIEVIKQANGMTSDHLKIGQVLRIPLFSSPEIASSQGPSLIAQKGNMEGQYRIKSGDNPWKIAKQLHMSVEDLLRLNGLDEGSARNLKPGDTIRIQ